MELIKYLSEVKDKVIGLKKKKVFLYLHLKKVLPFPRKEKTESRVHVKVPSCYAFIITVLFPAAGSVDKIPSIAFFFLF